MADDFPTDGVFLGSELQAHTGGGPEVTFGAGEDIEAAIANKTVNIGEAKCMGILCSCSQRIFARAQEEEEGNNQHVRHGVGAGMESSEVEGGSVLEDGEGHRFDTARRWVGAGVSSKLTLQAKVYFTGWGEAGIWTAHPRQGLADGA